MSVAVASRGLAPLPVGGQVVVPGQAGAVAEGHHLHQELVRHADGLDKDSLRTARLGADLEGELGKGLFIIYRALRLKK